MEDEEEEFEESDIVEGDIDDNSENIQIPIDGYAEFALFLKDKIVRIVVCKYTAVIYRSNDVENWTSDIQLTLRFIIEILMENRFYAEGQQI